MRVNNFEGRKFDHLTVVKKTGKKTKWGNSTWLCKCDCGKETVVAGGNLGSGHTTSCGCARGIANRRIRTTHGMRQSRQYSIWTGLKNRCNNPSNGSYKNYGGRGIKVCDRWLNSFENFWEDMESGYKDHLTIERINNNGNYEPSNCKWIPKEEQSNNRRDNDWITFNGETKTLSRWARSLGWDQSFLRGRIYRNGWSIKRALTTPKRKIRK